jgi:hypothetical protein
MVALANSTPGTADDVIDLAAAEWSGAWNRSSI